MSVASEADSGGWSAPGNATFRVPRDCLQAVTVPHSTQGAQPYRLLLKSGIRDGGEQRDVAVAAPGDAEMHVSADGSTMSAGSRHGAPQGDRLLASITADR